MATTIRIVAGTYEGLLYGWELPTDASKGKKMKLTFGYAAHSECIKSVAFMTAKHGKTLISGGNDETIKIYNVPKRVEVGTLMEHTGAVTCVEFFGQSHMLSGSADNSICIWRTSDWNCLHILGGHKGEVTSMAVHPSGKLAFSVARDRTLRMWNLVKGRIAYIRRLEKEASLVKMSQSGSRYALCFGTELTVFSSANAEVVGNLDHTDKIHAAVFASDDYVVCGGEDKFIYVWKVNGTLMAKFTTDTIASRIRCIEAVYPNGPESLPWIIVAASDGHVAVWDLNDIPMNPESPQIDGSVKPLTATYILSKPRVTCLSACIVPVDDSSDAHTVKKVKKVKKTAPKTLSAAELAAAPRIVVELDDASTETTKPPSKAGKHSGNKRKTGGSHQAFSGKNGQQHKKKKQHQKDGKK